MHSAEGRAGDENDTRSRRVAGHMEENNILSCADFPFADY